MVTYAEAIALYDSHPIVVFTISGIGNQDGLYKLCTNVPAYAANDARYKPYLTTFPDSLGEKALTLGGISESGSISLSILDYNNEVTSWFRFERPPNSFLTAAMTAVATGFTSEPSTPAIQSGVDVIYIGNEAMFSVNGKAGVTRAQLDTTAEAHPLGSAVYLSNPSLLGRRIRMYLTFDVDGYSESDENEIGSGWWVDGVSMDGLTTWVITGRTQAKFFDRMVYRKVFSMQAIEEESSARRAVVSKKTSSGDYKPHFSDSVFFEADGEVMEVVDPQDGFESQAQISILRRGVGGTRKRDPKTDKELYTQVFCADGGDSGVGSFRIRDKNDEAAGSWVAQDHPVPIILCIMTSPSDDSATGANYTAGQGNFSSLPAGIGLGIPASMIDFASFWSVWERTSTSRVRYFTLREQKTGRAVINELCALSGMEISTSQGRVRCRLVRAPLAGESSVVIDSDNIALEQTAPGNYVQKISAQLDSTLAVHAVEFKMTAPNGQPLKLVMTSMDYPSIFGDAAGYYESEDNKISIDATSVAADSAGTEPYIVRSRALSLLRRYRRPLWRISVTTDLALEGVGVGDLVKLSHAFLPNLNAGTRGWTDVVCSVETKTVTVDESGARIDWTLIVYSVFETARTIPSGMITSVSTNNATIAANRYTDPASTEASSDASQFKVGDRVIITQRNGDPYSTTPTYQTINAVSGNTLVLDGNFGGAGGFAAGSVITYAPADSATAVQLASWAYMADATQEDIGTTGQVPWTYGEP